MRHLLNTLFVTSEDIYLSLDGENVVANREKKVMARYPLHTLSAILSFSYPGASRRERRRGRGRLGSKGDRRGGGKRRHRMAAF